MIRSSLHPGKTAGDLAKERNKLEVSRRIDQVLSSAKKLDRKLPVVKQPKNWPLVPKKIRRRQPTNWMTTSEKRSENNGVY